MSISWWVQIIQIYSFLLCSPPLVFQGGWLRFFFQNVATYLFYWKILERKSQFPRSLTNGAVVVFHTWVSGSHNDSLTISDMN